MKERGYEKTFGSRYQEGEEGLQDKVDRDTHMEWGDPMDLVNGIQSSPFVYLVNIIVMLIA